MRGDQVVDSGGKVQVFSQDCNGVGGSGESGTQVPGEAVPGCGVADDSGGDGLVDEVTSDIDPLPVDLVRTIDAGLEGQLHSGPQVQITVNFPCKIEKNLS
jgi:hypothetical protein